MHVNTDNVNYMKNIAGINSTKNVQRQGDINESSK